MDVNDAYIKFNIKVTKNFGGKNITADKNRFVLIYNEVQIRRVIDTIRKGNDERIREIQFLLEPNKIISVSSKQKDRNLYPLPEDYLEFSSAYAIGKKGSCEDTITLHEIKDKNYSNIIPDNFYTPSFEYREAPFEIANNNINIFTGDFDMGAAYLTYYRQPRKIDIAGYQHEDGSPSKNINPEGDDRWVDEVISMAAAEFARNNSDIQEVSINKDRLPN